MSEWYDEFAESLDGERAVPVPLLHDLAADGRLLGAVGRDLRSDDGSATATAVRMIWTSDHLDAARRLQGDLVGPANVAVEERARAAWGALPRRRRRELIGSESAG
jgi:hypothetical protein